MKNLDTVKFLVCSVRLANNGLLLFIANYELSFLVRCIIIMLIYNGIWVINWKNTIKIATFEPL